MADVWSQTEVELIVSDYFAMLKSELNDIPYVKRAHRLELSKLLQNRSPSSIEKKHQNISAILLSLPFPYIDGYKPLGNYQKLLHDVVVEYVSLHPEFDIMAQRAIDQPLSHSKPQNILDTLVSKPDAMTGPSSQLSDSLAWEPVARKIDFVAREERNRALGEAGERFILEYERARLLNAGQQALAKRVEQISSTKGDGLGYDILSFELDGRERLIEVKTTVFGKYMPFYVSRNELLFSESRAEDYYLYRVFSFRNNPRFFQLEGSINSGCNLTPT